MDDSTFYNLPDTNNMLSLPDTKEERETTATTDIV